MVLGNPHFPWQGSERFYQSHLVIPGKVNVSGASLFGVPVINIGHTDEPRLDAHRLDRLPLRPGPAQARARRPDQLPGRRPAGEDGVQRRHRAGQAARRLARPGHADALHDPLRAGVHDAPGPVAVRLDADAPRTRCTTPTPTTCRYVNHFLDTNRAQSTNELLDVLQEVRGHPVGEHDGLRLARQGALRRHRLDPERAQREGHRRLPGAARGAHLPGPRAADPRRLALGVRAGHRPRLGRARDLRRPRACRRCSAATTSPTPTTPTGSPTPRSRSRASPGSSATSAPRARCAPGSG